VYQTFTDSYSSGWIGRLAHYGAHQNDEHRQALLAEAIRYSGVHLENDLRRSSFWSQMPLDLRAGMLLFLVDRGVVERGVRHGRRIYEPVPGAENWVAAQPGLRPSRRTILELIDALRNELLRRSKSRQA